MTISELHPTDHVSLHAKVEALLHELPLADYAHCVAALGDAVLHTFPALTHVNNPVNVRMELWTQDELHRLIQEYSVFSNAAIHMFLEARIRNHWYALTREIIHNMDEEFGIESQGIPHLELMRHGYRHELGIETEDVAASATTNDFIERMYALFKTGENSFLAGVLLAFEATAVDEFRTVRHMLQRYAELIGAEITADTVTGRYITGHVSLDDFEAEQEPEMEHYLGMVSAIGESIGGGDLAPLVRGFLSVALELNHWWEQLAVDTLQAGPRKLLAHRADVRTGATGERIPRLASISA